MALGRTWFENQEFNLLKHQRQHWKYDKSIIWWFVRKNIIKIKSVKIINNLKFFRVKSINLFRCYEYKIKLLANLQFRLIQITTNRIYKRLIRKKRYQ